MSSASEQESILREFCANTGANERLAKDILMRNKWYLPSSYREAERLCVSYNENTQPSSNAYGRPAPPPYSQISNPSGPPAPRVIAPVTGGGMVGGVGPAVVFDQRPSRPPSTVSPTPGTTVMSVNAGQGQRSGQGQMQQGQGHRAAEELRVALPPVRAPAERVVPIHVEGGRTLYGPESKATGTKSGSVSVDPVQSSTAGMARVTLDEKVVPSRPGMVPPRSSGSSDVDSFPAKHTLPASSTSVTSTTASNSTVSSTGKPPDPCPPKLRRGFSNILENQSLVSEARSNVLHDIEEDSHHHMYIQSFVLPDLTVHPEDFRAFLEKELIETSTLISLEQAGRLNWWAELGLCQRLMPLATTGDGNCLLHAASLAMWGIHDRQLILRKALYVELTDSPIKDNLYRRWRWQQTNVNKQSGLVFSEAEWKAEWENVLRLSSPSPRGLPETSTSSSQSCCDSAVTNRSSSVGSDPVVYESLEEFHVFVLAHVLQRPIIVVADTVLKDANGEDLAPIPFGGIYLPLECNAGDCYKSPLLLTYDAAHFSALVPMKQSSSDPLPLAIPVVDPELKILPLHFSYDPGQKFDWNCSSNKLPAELSLEDRLNLINRHMDVMQIPLSFGQNYSTDVLAPAVGTGGPPVPTTGAPNRQSSTGSSGSDESSQSKDSSTQSLVQNNQKDKDKKKDAKQNPVAKQFGSLGKSMGKKLKNIGSNLAPSKGKGETEKKPSLSGGLTQSTKVITALATTGDASHMVRCARLTCEQTEIHSEMVQNYLDDAYDRFLKDRELKRQKGEELRSRVALYPAAAAASRNRICSSTGCNYYAGPDSDLCSHCTRDQQRAWYYNQPQSKGQFTYNTFPGRHKVPPSPSSNIYPSSNEEIYRYGKSKFYTPTVDEVPVPPSMAGLYPPVAMDRQQSLSTGNVAATGRPFPAARPRSPSPDYDNVEYMKGKGQGSTAHSQNPTCLTDGCGFYGRRETDYLCSGCYKKRQANLAKPEKTTKL